MKITILLVAAALCAYIIYDFCDVYKPPQKRAPVIRMKDYPRAYMTFITTDGSVEVGDSVYIRAINRWCAEGHHGNQVLLVDRGQVKVITFEELRSMAKDVRQ